MKLALAHPGTGPFVQQTARALLEADLLDGYWTTFVDRPEASWRRALVGTAALLRIEADQELRRRAIDGIPGKLIHCAPFWEIGRTLASRMGLDSRFVDLVFEKEILNFDRWVANNALDKVDGVYGYEFSALASFREARKRGLACIYEVPSPEHEYTEGLIQKELQQFPNLNVGGRGYFQNRQARRTARRREEWALADVVIANSEFTRDTYASAGLDTSKVRVIPLGAPAVDQKKNEVEVVPETNPMKVLWAGTFSVRKGAHYLISAWRRILTNNNATLDVFGANHLPARLTDSLRGSVKIFPTVPPKILYEQYHAADILAFPTLCDGFGMVVMEAFAHGLPVITTPRAGAAKFVRHGENGLIVQPGDSAALAEALEWCLAHRDQLRAMRRAALDTAKSWQWEDFRSDLRRNLFEGLRDAGFMA